MEEKRERERDVPLFECEGGTSDAAFDVQHAAGPKRRDGGKEDAEIVSERESASFDGPGSRCGGNQTDECFGVSIERRGAE